MKSIIIIVLVVVGVLLVGGIVIVVFMKSGDKLLDFISVVIFNGELCLVDGNVIDDGVCGDQFDLFVLCGLEYVDVLKVDLIIEKQKVYVIVIGIDLVCEIFIIQILYEVCQDVMVQECLLECDGNVGGIVVGVVVGGLFGNQVGGGNGKKVVIVVGVVVGGFIGNQIDKCYVGGCVVNCIECQCYIEIVMFELSCVIGYNVIYCNEDGIIGIMCMVSKLGSCIVMGINDVVKGYNVIYCYDGVEKIVCMDNKLVSDCLLVVDGQLVMQIVVVGVMVVMCQ